MVHLICYGAALALNLGWLLLGDHLSLWTQVSVPVFTVLIAGIGVALRLWELPRGEARRRYLRGAMWVFLVYYLAILSVLLFFGGLFHMDRGWGGNINLEPFHTIRNYIRYYRNTGSHVSIFNLLGNVVIMVPMGALLPGHPPSPLPQARDPDGDGPAARPVPASAPVLADHPSAGRHPHGGGVPPVAHRHRSG